MQFATFMSFITIVFSMPGAWAESLCGLLPKLAKNPIDGKPLSSADQADYILIDKSRRLLYLMDEKGPLKSYRIALGKKPYGPKTCDGDKKTPEGVYHIEYKNSQSDYHLSLKISYPNTQDIENAKMAGCDPGGEIMIHGLPNDPIKRFFINHPKDWTKGCAAVTNREIEEIYRAVDAGITVELCK